MLFPASFEVEQRERDSNWIIFVTELPTDSTCSRVAIELRDSPFITDLITMTRRMVLIGQRGQSSDFERTLFELALDTVESQGISESLSV